MTVIDGLGGLELDDEVTIDEEIGIVVTDDDTVVEHRERLLLFDDEPALTEFMGEAFS